MHRFKFGLYMRIQSKLAWGRGRGILGEALDVGVKNRYVGLLLGQVITTQLH